MALKDRYYTVSEAARELGVTRQTISRWTKEGKIPSEKVGRETLIKKKDLSKYQRDRLASAAAYRVLELMYAVHTEYFQKIGYITAVERVKDINPRGGRNEIVVEKFDGTSRILPYTHKHWEEATKLAMPKLKAFLRDFNLSIREILSPYITKKVKGGKESK